MAKNPAKVRRAYEKRLSYIISHQLKNLGFEVGIDEWPQIHAKNDKFMVRVHLDQECINIGDRKSFDRWANSDDYFFEGLPDTEEELGLVFKIAADCIADGIVRPIGCDSIVLNTWWRQYKRQADKERYEASKLEG